MFTGGTGARGLSGSYCSSIELGLLEPVKNLNFHAIQFAFVARPVTLSRARTPVIIVFHNSYAYCKQIVT